MNDKDKEAFEEWWMEGFKGMSDMAVIKYVNVGKQTSLHGWQAACYYKQKEIDELLAENAKLRETLKLAVESASFFSKFADCTKDYWSCRCEFCRRNKIISRG